MCTHACPLQAGARHSASQTRAWSLESECASKRCGSSSHPQRCQCLSRGAQGDPKSRASCELTGFLDAALELRALEPRLELLLLVERRVRGLPNVLHVADHRSLSLVAGAHGAQEVGPALAQLVDQRHRLAIEALRLGDPLLAHLERPLHLGPIPGELRVGHPPMFARPTAVQSFLRPRQLVPQIRLPLAQQLGLQLEIEECVLVKEELPLPILGRRVRGQCRGQPSIRRLIG
eukprot:scaffold3445_cov118-Isochrysis_galbana.AAC.2